jgi:hypothetical protein
MLYLNGADFVTIDGLTFTDGNSASNTVAMEFGVALFKRTAGDGCNNNTIQNCTFNMQRVSNSAGSGPTPDGSCGIYVLNSTAAAAATALTPTNGGTLATNGTNSGNRFYSNTINSGNGGIHFGGFAATTGVGPAPVATTFLGDLNNDVGGASAATANTILNFGGGAVTSPAAGIRANFQWGINISFNTVNNNNGAGVNHATTLRGIYGQAGTSANATINSNIVTIQSGATTSACNAIENVIGSTAAANTVTINNNTINVNYSTATTGAYTGILNSATAAIVNINGSIITKVAGGDLAGTGTHVMIETGSPTTVTANSNSITNITRGGASGSWRGIKMTSPTNFTANSNTIDSLSWTAAASTGGIDAIYSISSAVNVTANSNIITNLSTPTTGTITGINEFGVSGLKTYQNNQIHNFSTTAGGAGGATLRGISESTGSTNDFSGNQIFSLNSTGTTGGTSGTIVGITVSSGTTNNIYKNKIYDLSSTSTGPTVSAITASGGTTDNIYNNLMGDLRATAANAANPLIGLNVTGGTTVNAYFNTVYLAGSSSGALFGSSAVSVSTTPTVTLADNAFVNASSTTGAGLAVAYRRSTATLTTYGSASNNNDFFGSTTYTDGTNTDVGIAAYKTRVASRDSASFSENPPFLSTTGSSANFLHINTTIATQLESGGAPIAGITTDFDGQTRNATTPDVGADEFTGIAADFTPPTISYTALGNDLAAGTRSFSNITITDASGVNTTAGTRPRVYYKKSTNANTFNDNTSGTDGWKFAEASGAGGSPFSFTIDYSLLFGGGGVSNGDVVQYFVVAQDLATTPNVGINSGTFAATPSSVALTAAAFPISGSINSYNIVPPLTGTFNVGIGQTYADVTAAVAALNNSILSGPVTFLLTDASYASGPGNGPNAPAAFPLTINANSGSSATNTITIKPASGISPTISAAAASGALLTIKASYVTVDGSNNGTSSRDLTITNSSATSPTVIAIASSGTGAGATNNTIKNCNISTGSVAASSYGIAIGGATPGTAGADNDSVTIQNNNITSVYYGIYANGTAAVSAGGLDGLAITNNLIGPAVSGATNTGFAGISVANALSLTVSGNTVRNLTTTVASAGGVYLNSNVNGATISQNTITNITSSASSSGTASITALYLGTSVFNATVSRNTITTVASTTISGYGARAVIVNTGFNGSNDTIVNNMISDVSNFQDATVTLYATVGLDIEASGGINVYFNSINLFGDHAGYASNTTGGVSTALMVNTTGTNVDVRNNVFSNTYNNTTSTGDKSYAIYSFSANGATFSNIDYNDYYVGGNGTPVLGFINSADQATLAAIQTSFGGNTHSVSGNPQFNSATDLHINPAIGTLVESGGTPIAGVTTDIDGDTRNLTTPDIGADEGNFTQVVTNDISATAFVSPTNGGGVVAGAMFSPQASFTNNGTANQTNVTVRYRILDAMAVEVYNNTQVIASIASNASTTVTFASTSLSAGTYTIKAKAELVGDQVPANDEITGSISVQAPLSGGYTVGAAGNYPTLTQAVNTLNSLGITGPVVLTLLDSSNTTAPTNTGEVFPIQVNAISGASATNTVTIKPANPGTTITGSSATALIILNGSDYVTIDGSSNGTSSRDLTMTNNNTGATSAVIWLQTNVADGATNNTIKNVNLVGNSNTTTLFGVGSGSSTISTASLGTGNNNNTFQNCNISKTQYGIYSMGASAASKNSGTVINQNLINTASPNNVSVGGILVGFEDTIQIVGNNISGMSQPSSPDVVGISAGFAHSGFSTTTTGPNEVTNAIIANNIIGSVVNTGTFSAVGIGLAAATSGTSTIANNMISGVVANGTAGDFSGGIALGGGAGSTTNVYFNSVSFSGTITGASSASQVAACLAVTASTAPTLDVRDNIFTNTQLGNTGATVRFVAVALGYSSTTGNYSGLTSNFNDLRCTGAGPGTYQVGETGGLTAGTVRTALSDWQTETGRDANSISADPGFISATNLHLTTSPIPPVSGAGTTIGSVATDIDGDLRQSPPDIGADEIITYTLTYTAGANGTISGTSPQTVISGGSGTAVTAVPNTGYHFVNWSDASTQNPRTDTNVMSDITVTANFAINTYTLTYTAGANGSISGTSPQTVNFGGSGSAVTAVPNTGYHFVNWSDSSTQNPRTDTNVMADISVTATFAINTYTLTYTAGANGSISGTSPQTVNFGGSGTAVTAVPDSGYSFVNWSDSSTQNPRTDTNVMADVNVTANFAAVPSFSINDVSQAETNSGQTAFTFTVTKSGTGAATVDFQTQNGTATAGSDYVANNGTLTFGPTDTMMPVTVLVNGDTIPEPNETFTVHLSNASVGAVISDADGLGTITNDDGAPATVYVNAAWAGVPCGQDPDGAGPATSMCFDAFATIQDGVNGVAMVVAPAGAHLPTTGPTVIVAPGTYPEAVTVTSSMTLSGPQAGQNANTRFAAFVPGPNGPKANPAVEAIITAAATAPTSGANDTMHIMADGVIIDGFVFDGNNPSLPQGGAVVIGGINTDSRTGIQTEDAAGNNFSTNNVLIENNIVQNFAGNNANNLGGGVTLVNPTDTSPATSGGVVTGNVVRNFGAYGILLSNNAYGDVTFNTVDTPEYPTANAGIWVYDFPNNGVGPKTINITSNNVTVGQDNFGGIWINLVYAPAATININNNTVNAAAGVLPQDDFTYGIYLSSLLSGTTAHLSANTVGSAGGTFDRGIALWNLGTSPTGATVTGGTVGHSVKGVSLHDDDPNFGLAGSNSAVDLSGVSIDGTTVGIFVDATGSTGDTVAMQIFGNTSISNTTTAISVVGANASANIHDNSASIHDNTAGIDVNAASATITSNNLYANATGLRFSNGASATAHFNRIISTTTAIDNPNNLTLNLENNWWGCNAGPGNTGCGAVTGTGADFNPWIVLQVSALPNPIAPGGQSTVTADMTHNSDNVVPVGTLPDMAVAFTATQGTMTPTSGTITSGQATSMFTSTSNSDGTATATVDGQPATTVINVTSPTFSINDVTMNEGNSGPTSFVFTVTKTGSTPFTSTVDFATVNGTATVADNDYVANSGTLTFGPTDTMMQVTVIVNGDTKYEADETFTVELSNPTVAGESITGGVVASGLGTITNDDLPPTFSINDVTMNEGNSGPTSFVFTVTKSGSTGLSSSVNFTTQDGTATLADNDYQMNSGMLNFGPSDTMMQITVLVNGDTTVEPDETFNVHLSGAVNATIFDADGTGTITNDDVAPPNIVYVDDNWIGVPNGQDPDGGGPATAMGYDAFATIQGGVNGVANPGTVIVYAGNYPEAVTVNKSLTINGAKAGQNANARFAAFVPGPNGPKADPAVESILTAAATDPNSGANDTLHVMANNVSFNGFVVDGNNPSLPQGGAVVVGGINTDSRRAIQTEDAAGNPFPANNLAVSYNIMQNFSQRGVELIPGTASNTAPATSGNVITQNLVRNFGLDGIVMAFNAYADVTFNTVVTNDFPTEAGIWVQDFLNTGTPHTMNITNNNVTVGQDNFGGIWINLAYLAAVNVNNNTVNAAAGVTSGDDFTYGIYVTSLRPGTTAQLNGNTVGASGGEFDRGIALWNIGTSPTTTAVKDGSVKNSVDGISLVYNDANFGAAGSSSTANVSGMTVSGSQVGVVVDATGSGANTVTMTVTNSTLSGNTAANGGGITSSGTGGVASTTITNSTLSGNSPSGASILLQDASLTIGNTIFNTGASGTNISALGTSVVSSRGYNLSSDNFGGFLTATGDQVNTDPMLGPLKDNGGPTLTHAPLEGSPAIDQGKDIGPIGPAYTATGEDQRGSMRPVNDPAIPNAVGGDGSDIGAVELAVGVHASSAASRKTHGAAGDFDISLPLTGPVVGIECRGTGAATNLYKMVLIFENPVTFSGAAVTSGTGTVDSVMTNSVIVAGVSGTQVTINLSGVTDVQTLTVGLFDVDDGVNMGDVGVRMHVLIGDATGNGAVNSSDITFIKAKLGAVVNGTTFRADITANGDINSSDVALTKSKIP